MADLILSGTLDLSGSLKLNGSAGGKVKVGSAEVLTVDAKGSGVPVLQPPQAPLDEGTDVKVARSFNSSVSANGKLVVTQGLTKQGSQAKNYPWPGMILPSAENKGVKVDGLAINVKSDQAMTLPNGGSVAFNDSGQ